MRNSISPIEGIDMYLTVEDRREEYAGTVIDAPTSVINEAYQDEAFDIFMNACLTDGGISNEISVKDDLSGDEIIIYAEDHLSQEQLSNLKKFDEKIERSFNPITLTPANKAGGSNEKYKVS